LISKIDEFHKQNIKLKVIGRKNFSKKLNLLLNSAEKKTSKNSKIQINLALNYGSKFELVNAIKKIVKNNFNINEKNIEKFLYTKNIPNPDLLIRTGNTKRLSNFLLWQLAYSEIFFEKKLWPDFNEYDYSKIINKFRKVKRNYGNV
jgi:undecaprenyl diphosphate synthase